MRTDVVIDGTYRRIRYNPDGSIRSDGTFTTQGAMMYTDIRPDRDRNPKPKGWLPPKAYSMSTWSSQRALGEVSTYDSEGRRSAWYQGFHPLALGIGEFDDFYPTDQLLDASIKSCLRELKSQTASLGVAVAEAGQTKRLASSAIDSIKDFMLNAGTRLTNIALAGRALKKGKWKDAYRHLGLGIPKSAPANWLALQYGVLPLLTDIRDGLNAMRSTGLYGHMNVGVKCSPYWKQNDKVFNVGTNIVEEIHIRKRSGVLTRLDYEPSDAFLVQINQVGILDPLPILWELIPWSFVADWVLPIGDWLDLMQADAGWKFKSGSSTHFQLVNLIQSFSHSPNGSVGGWYKGMNRRVSMVREIYFNSPSAAFPRWKSPFDDEGKHLANGLSLIATVFSGRGPK